MSNTTPNSDPYDPEEHSMATHEQSDMTADDFEDVAREKLGMPLRPTDPAAIDLDEHRTGGSSNTALIAAVEALREREAELVGALRVAAAALEITATWIDELGHHGTAQGVQHDVNKARAVLSATPAEALERARAAEKVAGYSRHTQYCDLIREVTGPNPECTCGLGEALARLDQSTVAPAKADAGEKEG